jgi:predicted HicB family RNase H-like nuclease
MDMIDTDRIGRVAVVPRAGRHPGLPPEQGVGAATVAVLEVAEKLYRMAPDWVVFFREVLGVEGIVRRTFCRPESLARFESSPEYARIREMLDDLRRRQQEQPPERHKHRVITVRMPRELHETLRAEADELRVSINTLCLSKLMKLLDAEGREEIIAAHRPRGSRQPVNGPRPDHPPPRRNLPR